MDASRILLREEVSTVLADLKKKAVRSPNARLNLILFRLSCCCGLRCCELCGLNIGDVLTSGNRPEIRIRKDNTKGRPDKRKARRVPLWWDAGTLEDITKWLEARLADGAQRTDPFLCGTSGKRLTTDLAAKRWRTGIKSLGAGRVSQLSIHKGRHSFCSHALASGRNLPHVRDAMGHRSISTTSIYLHTLEQTGVPDIFQFTEKK